MCVSLTGRLPKNASRTPRSWRGTLQRASFQHDMGFIGLLLLLLQDTPPLERQLQRQPLLWVLKIMAQQVADMVEPVEQ